MAAAVSVSVDRGPQGRRLRQVRQGQRPGQGQGTRQGSRSDRRQKRMAQRRPGRCRRPSVIAAIAATPKASASQGLAGRRRMIWRYDEHGESPVSVNALFSYFWHLVENFFRTFANKAGFPESRLQPARINRSPCPVPSTTEGSARPGPASLSSPGSRARSARAPDCASAMRGVCRFQIGDAEPRQARLRRADQVARPADRQILLGDAEPVLGLAQDHQPPPRRLAQRRAVQQQAGRGRRPAPHPRRATGAAAPGRKVSACSITMIEALGTSTPTSITVVATSTLRLAA
jgi:hypothetical protein